jgi:hypothetical protein
VRLTPATWETEKAAGSPYLVPENINASYEGDIALMDNIQIIYPGYDLGFDNLDGPVLAVNATATLQRGFIYSVNVTFWENYSDSAVAFQHSDELQSLTQNLTLLSLSDFWRTGHRGSGLKAFLTLAATNQSKSVHFYTDDVSWRLFSPFNQTHQMEVDVEIIYYNGTSFERLVQPFLLKISSDNNNTFQDATLISEGTNYTNLYVGYQDPLNYYKIYLNRGQTIKVQVDGISQTDVFFRVCVYDPEERLSSETPLDVTQTIEFASDLTGYWFILVEADNGGSGNSGFYNMEVTG